MSLRLHYGLEYVAQKSFRFFGKQYEPGDAFNPQEAQCPPAKLRTLVQQRFIRIAEAPVKPVAARELPSEPEQEQTTQTPTEVIDEAQTKDSEPDQTDVDKKAKPKPKKSTSKRQSGRARRS